MVNVGPRSKTATPRNYTAIGPGNDSDTVERPERGWQALGTKAGTKSGAPPNPGAPPGLLSSLTLRTKSRLAPIVGFFLCVRVLADKAMTTLPTYRNMKTRVTSTLLGLALTFTTAGVSHAMSELLSLSSEPLWPTSSTPNSNLVYNITTVGRGGSGLLEVTLTAGAMPPGVTVTFSPSVLRFTGNQLTAQTATMTVHCSSPIPLDCYPFTLTGTAQRESVTVTNLVMFTPEYVAIRPPTLYLDNLGNGALRLRGLGATAKTYRIEARSALPDTVWTPQGSAIADGNGRFTFFTAQAADAPMRFYRAVESAP